MKKILLTIGLILTILFSHTIDVAYAEDAAIPDSILAQEQEDHTNALIACGDNEACIEEANQAHDERMARNQEIANIQNIAETEAPENGIRIDNQFKPINAPDAFNRNYTTSTVNAFLQFIAGSLIEITGSVAIFVLVIAGYMFVTAGGDQGRIDKAKEIIKYTIMGMLLVILSFVIVKTIISLILEVDTF